MVSGDRRSDVAKGPSDQQDSSVAAGQQQERDSQVSVTTEMDLRSPDVAGSEPVESPSDGPAPPQATDQWDEEDWGEEDEKDA